MTANPTTATQTLAEFISRRLDEDEAAARDASRHYAEPIVDGGEHWRWECRDDEVVTPDLDAEFMECSHEDWAMSLRSVEQYPYRSFEGEGPSIHLSPESEVRPAVAAHIARHDPARVLADVAAKRAVLAWHDSHDDCCEERYGPLKVAEPATYASTGADGDLVVRESIATQAFLGCVTLMHLAAPYSSHPDYRAGEWAP